jgi:hypothetical protein
MKKLIVFISLLSTTFLISAQTGETHQVNQIINKKTVEINIGDQFNVERGDEFQVFGQATVIHPATGQLIERDNVLIGRIKVIDVKDISSIAEVIGKKHDFKVGNTVQKVLESKQEIIENKKPLQYELQNPNERNYSETIYSINRNSDRKRYQKFQVTNIDLSTEPYIVTINHYNEKTVLLDIKYVVNVPDSINVKKYYPVALLKTDSIKVDIAIGHITNSGDTHLKGKIHNNNYIRRRRILLLDVGTILILPKVGVRLYVMNKSTLKSYLWFGAGVGMGLDVSSGYYFSTGFHFKPIEIGGWNYGIKYRYLGSNSEDFEEKNNSFLLALNYNNLYFDLGVLLGSRYKLNGHEITSREFTIPELSIGYLF